MLLRQRKIPITGLDDARALPAGVARRSGARPSSGSGRAVRHAAGYKVMAYNNPYVVDDRADAARTIRVWA